MTVLRQLNSEGTKQFAEFVRELRSDPSAATPRSILTDPITSAPVLPDISIDERTFESKFAMAEYLQPLMAKVPSGDDRRGVANWLALFHFDLLCPVDSSGARKPTKREESYVLSERSHWGSGTYRHRIAGPLWLYEIDPETARIFLDPAPSEHGEELDTLFANQTWPSLPGFRQAYAKLYFEPGSTRTWKVKVGARSKNRPGNVRRLTHVMHQFDLTFDIGSLSADALLQLLPAEFAHFRGDAIKDGTR